MYVGLSLHFGRRHKLSVTNPWMCQQLTLTHYLPLLYQLQNHLFNFWYPFQALPQGSVAYVLQLRLQPFLLSCSSFPLQLQILLTFQNSNCTLIFMCLLTAGSYAPVFGDANCSHQFFGMLLCWMLPICMDNTNKKITTKNIGSPSLWVDCCYNLSWKKDKCSDSTKGIATQVRFSQQSHTAKLMLDTAQKAKPSPLEQVKIVNLLWLCYAHQAGLNTLSHLTSQCSSLRWVSDGSSQNN